MRTTVILGSCLLLMGVLAATGPSLTGAVVGAPSSNSVFLLSIPFVALGAAIIANSLRLFTN